MEQIKKIPTYDYLKGHDFTNNLKRILGCKNLQDVAKVTGVSTSTLSTWNMENRTSHELMIRIHMALNIPIRDLALGYSAKDIGKEPMKITESNLAYALPTDIRNNVTFDIKTYKLKDGKLENRHLTLFDTELLPDVNHEHIIAIKELKQMYIIDTQVKQAVFGTYLVDIDGFSSLNEVQRVPNKKLLLTFNDSVMEVKEEDISVIGKLVAEVTVR